MNDAYQLKSKVPKARQMLHVDLGNLKTPWLAYCAKNNVTPSQAIRDVLKKIAIQSTAAIAPAVEIPGKRDPQRKTRKEIRLTESEVRQAERVAEANGFSVQMWMAALVRAQLTQNPQFGLKEQQALGESNYQLLSIGRNLNQIAKALNTYPEDRRVYQIDQLDELRAAIKQHVKKVSAAMQSTSERWTLI